jgi:NADPH:quinone reductase-like Zn-dependent oxidoreductase
MKSIRIRSYGGADAMRLEDAPMPECGASDLLVHVVAAGVNPIDWKIRSGAMAQGAERRFPLTLGWVAAGTVATAGGDVVGFRSGDEVCFYADFARGGCYAEYAAVDASQVAAKPRTMSFAQAAALPMSGQAAWTALIETARIRSGMRVLIHGAAGALGSVAVQLARDVGAEVIGTASGAGLDVVAGLGATRTIDYRNERFETLVGDVDVVLDTIGGATQEASWSTLRPGGLLVATAMPPPPGRAEAAGARGAFVFTRPDGHVLAELARRADAGRLHVLVGEEFALADAKHAHSLGEAGGSRAKMVLHVAVPASR